MATGWAAHAAHHVGNQLVKTGMVSAAYLGTYVVLFGVKFAAYEWVIFVPPREA